MHAAKTQKMAMESRLRKQAGLGLDEGDVSTNDYNSGREGKYYTYDDVASRLAESRGEDRKECRMEYSVYIHSAMSYQERMGMAKLSLKQLECPMGLAMIHGTIQ